jgi:hypothetical protein
VDVGLREGDLYFGLPEGVVIWYWRFSFAAAAAVVRGIVQARRAPEE